MITRRARSTRRAAVADRSDSVREGPPPGVGRLRWQQTEVLGQPLAVLAHPERGTLTTALELDAGEEDGSPVDGRPADGRPVEGRSVDGRPVEGRSADARPVDDVRLRDLLARVGGAATPFVRLQLLVTDRPPGRARRFRLVAAMPLDRRIRAEALAVGEGSGGPLGDRSARGLALLAGRATLDLARHLAEAGIPIRAFLDADALAALIRSRYDPGPGPAAGGSGGPVGDPWPTDIDATDHRHLRTVTPAASGAARSVGWFHATAWLKSWPTAGTGGIDLAAPLGPLPGLTLPRTAALVLAVGPGEGPAAAAYLTVSARTPVELQLARAQLRRPRDAEPGLHLEWTDREHHLAFVHTLPLATGLAPVRPAEPPAAGMA